jgi:hypothetical protein
LKAKNIKIHRAHLDNFLDPKNSNDSTSYVTMLRLLVSPDPLSTFDSNELNSFMKDIKRTKWLDDEVINMGLFKHPTMGIEKAEVIVALCSMLHGPLSKENNQSYASIKTLISILKDKQISKRLLNLVCLLTNSKTFKNSFLMRLEFMLGKITLYLPVAKQDNFFSLSKKRKEDFINDYNFIFLSQRVQKSKTIKKTILSNAKIKKIIKK